MFKYFIEGGPLFMGMLTIVLLAGVSVFVLTLVGQSKEGDSNVQGSSKKINTIKSIGLFGFVLGMLGQFIGLFDAFKAIGGGMDVTPQLMAQGLKVSSITSIYGMIIFLILYLCAFVLMIKQKNNASEGSEIES